MSQRPPQARAVRTRQRLLDATVQALNGEGYSGTTTQEVCRRAGVSRGTLLHHFGTRNELLVAALRHILSDRVATFVATNRDAVANMTPAELLERMWVQWQGPALAAWLELAVAARTDEELRLPMQRVMAEFDQQVVAAFRELLGPNALPGSLGETVPFVVFAILNGLAVGQSYEAPGHHRPVLDLLKVAANGWLGADRD